MTWKHCLKKLAIKTVRFYQIAISPHFGRVCRFEPTCSQYCILVIEKYGLAKGIFLTTKRILKCNPFYS
ncbi:MAG: membrane protein insertion efficiency factor YidD [bacterium]